MIELEFNRGLTLMLLFFLPSLSEEGGLDVRLRIGIVKYIIHAGAWSEFHSMFLQPLEHFKPWSASMKIVLQALPIIKPK